MGRPGTVADAAAVHVLHHAEEVLHEPRRPRAVALGGWQSPPHPHTHPVPDMIAISPETDRPWIECSNSRPYVPKDDTVWSQSPTPPPPLLPGEGAGRPGSLESSHVFFCYSSPRQRRGSEWLPEPYANPGPDSTAAIGASDNGLRNTDTPIGRGWGAASSPTLRCETSEKARLRNLGNKGIKKTRNGFPIIFSVRNSCFPCEK